MIPEFRILDMTDIYAVKDLAKLIWDGDDYLGKVAKSWIEDGGFLGMFDVAKLIGCVKITKLPNQVIWLEGLRVHPDYRSKGLGKQLSAMALDAAKQFVRSGEALHIEFSTYFMNVESINISTQAGFKPIDEYYIMRHKAVKPTATNQHYRIHDDITDYFPKSIPYGWKFLHPTKQSTNWLNKRAHLLKAEGGYFYVTGEEPTVCLLSPAGDWIEKALPLIQYFLGKKQEINLLLHPSRKFEIETLQSLGFHWWEDDVEDKVIVFRYMPD